jgi:NTP pyrophosphatase (non-canonical NTP hydrolase)
VTLNELEGNVIAWGRNKGILDWTMHFKRKAQFTKTKEEVQELEDAIGACNRDEVIDAIGDVMVTLIMQAVLWDTNLNECLHKAYEQIKERQGRMVDGVFVKDA